MFKKHKSYFAFLICIIFTLNNAHSFVHCQSADGHRDIEFIGSACCNTVNKSLPPLNAATSSKEAFSTSRYNCGPCVDTPISMHFCNTAKRITQFFHAVTPISAVLSSTVDPDAGFKHHSNSEINACANPFLLFIRTIILLA